MALTQIYSPYSGAVTPPPQQYAADGADDASKRSRGKKPEQPATEDKNGNALSGSPEAAIASNQGLENTRWQQNQFAYNPPGGDALVSSGSILSSGALAPSASGQGSVKPGFSQGNRQSGFASNTSVGNVSGWRQSQHQAQLQGQVRIDTPATTNTSLPEEEINPATMLATVQQHNQQQRITGRAVFQDMRQTGKLLGATAEVEADIERYLQLAENEASQPQPNGQLIETLLRRSAEQLDGHVSASLGSPSSVVQEWVDALMEQEIVWNDTLTPLPETSVLDALQTPISASTTETSGSESQAPAVTPLAEPIAANRGETGYFEVDGNLNMADSLRVRGLIDAYQQAATSNDWSSAHRSLDRALAIVSGVPNHPLATRLNWLKANTYTQQGKLQQALGSLTRAESSLGPADSISRARLLLQKGQLQQQLKQNEASQATIGSGLQLAKRLMQQSDTPLSGKLAPLWLEQARHQQRATQLPEAAATLTELATLQREGHLGPSDPKTSYQQHQLSGQLLWKLGNRNEAETALRQALTEARRNNDLPAYQSSLQSVAAFYLDHGQVSKAQRLLAYLSTSAKK